MAIFQQLSNVVMPPPVSLREFPRYALAFRSAHRAFIIADNFFRITALIGLRPVVFLETGVTFFGADLPSAGL
jgi:hypothetical protein